jgi:hypothetical protein
MRHVTRIIGMMICAALLMTGCDGKTEQPEALPAARPLLEEAAGKIQDAETFQLTIDVNGFPVTIETGSFTLPMDVPLLFQYAQGVFVAPNRLQATVEVTLGEFGATAELIAIDQEQYMRSDLLTQNRWIQQQIIPGFSPATLVAPQGGIAYALDSIFQLEMQGIEDLEGVEVYHLTGKINASDVYALTFGLIGTKEGQMDASVYILTENRMVEQVVIHEPLPPDAAEGEEPTTWTIQIMNYNDPATVSTPEVEPTNEG